MTLIRLAAAAAVTLLVATGCGASETTGDRELPPADGGEETERAPRPAPSEEVEQTPGPVPSAEPGPRAEATASGSDPRPGAEGTGSPFPDPTAEPGPEPQAGGEGVSPGNGNPGSFGTPEASGTPKSPGASGSPSTSETPEASEVSKASEEATEEYMDALAAVGDPDRMRRGLEYAAEDSDARDYLLHQVAVAQAWADAGESDHGTDIETTHDADVERVDDGYELCRTGEPATGSLCAEYGGFTHEDGLVDGLLVEGRDPGPGLLVPDGTGAGVESEGVRATLLTAYQSVIDKSLVVTVEFATAENADLDLLAASYRQDGGREYRTLGAAGRFDLDAGTATHAVFAFPGAVPGGDLSVGGCLEECSASVDIELPVD